MCIRDSFFTVLIFVLIVYFSIKYRARPGHRAIEVHAPMSLEIAWSVIPLAMCLVMFWWGTELFISASRPPAGAMEIYVCLLYTSLNFKSVAVLAHCRQGISPF